jgi:protein O-GlcNAc transferase
MSGSTEAQFARAVDLFQRGQIDAAGTLCHRIIEVEPRHANALHILGIVAIQKGEPQRGLELIQQAIGIDGQQPFAWCSQGNALRDLQRPLDALASYQRAIVLVPQFAGAHYSAGNAYSDLGRWAEALASYDRALTFEPRYAEAHQNRGNALSQLGRLDEALTSYEAAFQHQPSMTAALIDCAETLRQLHRPAEAIQVLDRFLLMRPGDTDALVARGNLLLELNRAHEALESFERLLAGGRSVPALYGRARALLSLNELNRCVADCDSLLRERPDLAEAWCTGGAALFALDRMPAALESFRQALQRQPQMFEAHNGYGLTLQSLHRHDEALESFDAALRIRPEALDVKYRRAVALRGLGRHTEAARAFEEIYDAAPGYNYIVGNLLHARLQSCDWTDYEQLRALAAESVRAGERAYLPGPYFTVSNSAGLELQCALTFVADKGLNGRAEQMPPWVARPRPGRICIAYVSGDFREHPVSQLLAGLLEEHDRSRFRVLGISLQPEQDSTLGRRIKRGFDEFIDASAYDDRSLATLMRELDVDIAVDLMGFSGGSRPGLFALRPAPVQVTYLGFAGTMGTTSHDYIIADRHTIPMDHRKFYTEQVVWLPECFQPNDHKRTVPRDCATREQHGLPQDALVFCCFNTPYKISPPIFSVWMRLLAVVDHSVLWLPDGGEEITRNLRNAAAGHGISPERLIFAPRLPELEQHLARYRLADLFLDTLPYNAHTTASDALWAGLPVLTCEGDSFAARVASSLLRTIGAGELVTTSLAEYEIVARNVALDPASLRRLRARLEAARADNPLFNTVRYARHLESAYAQMIERHYSGQPAQPIQVDPLPS